MQQTAKDIMRARAPKLTPWGYGEARGWDEYDTTRIEALAALVDAAEPEHADDDYSRSDAFRAFESLVQMSADAEEERRTAAHYRGWIDETAEDIAREMLDENQDATDADEIDSDDVWERVDSACPIYTYEIERVFTENNLDVDDGEVKALAGEDADLTKLQQVATFEALKSAVYEAIRDAIDARNEEREEWEAYADELHTAYVERYPDSEEADAYA